MTELRPDTVAIHQLRIRRDAGAGSAAIRQGSASLRQEIEHADWPRAAGESWVFVRRLETRAPRDRLTRQLVQDARQQVLGGGSDNVVRFSSLSELLAALLADLVQGRAPGRWYWRRWRHLFRLPLPQAITDLLADHLAHLPAVCAVLGHQRTLEPVWLSLDTAGTHQLSRELAWRGGFAVPDAAVIEAQRAGWSKGRVPAPEPRVASAIQSRWRPVLRQLPLQDARHRLALLLIGQETAPLMLQRAPATLLAGLHTIMVGSPPAASASRAQTDANGAGNREPKPPPVPLAPPAQSLASGIEKEKTRVSVKLRRETQADAMPAGRQQIPQMAGHEADRGPHQTDGASPDSAAASIAAATVANTSGSPRTAAPATPTPIQALQIRHSRHDTAFDQFHTRQGGLLYLLNFLNRPEPRALMEESWAALPSGWGWLYRLGQELLLEETDPLVAFIAAQLGFDHPAELQQLPSLPARTELLELAQRWYGRAGLWQPDLLQLSARVRYSPSHVDLHAPMTAVRLPVRLAGLDIDPGWLPWLGRVVTFHYE